MGPSKRASEHVASQKALLFLQSRHLLPPGPDIIPKIPDPAAASAARPVPPPLHPSYTLSPLLKAYQF